ncbi:MAG: flagellar biosynthetic protein FliR [Gammaproteobacteria bacterium]|nr:flagellar biosynthetic protein FliR [Pseudomonadales bacterium]MCP5349042.1 flagellar biosynthetic protein FliR [Pseudomonadales bacterium]
MEIAIDDIMAMTGDFFWPFLRISALFAVAPVFSARSVPVRVRIILALLITLLIQPSLPYLEPIEPLSAIGFLLILQQLGIGIVMGLIMQIVMSALVMAGQAIATTMGLGFASSVDPQNGVQVTMLGQFYLIIGTLYLLAVDGHLLLIDVLVQSFVSIPVGEPFNAAEIFGNVALFTAELFVAAILIALPVIVGVLLVNLAFGVVTRAAPQLNIFAVGFPATMLAGFVLILFSIPVLFPTLTSFFAVGFDFMRTLVN